MGYGIEQAARRIGDLNCRPATVSPDFPSFANPDVQYLEGLESQGISWHLGDLARRARDRATLHYGSKATAATVHGDVHLRNVLLRGDTEPHLIDYAGSGPGHPAIDLARLEVALYLTGARHLDSEEKCIELQIRLSIDGLSADDLIVAFPNYHKCFANIACTRGMVAARNESLRVLNTYGGGLDDYLAAKYLVAWQALVINGMPTAAARSIIIALSPALAT